MATETQTKLVGFCLGDKTNYNATNYANHIWFDPTNKQILLNGIEYIPKKLSELVNDKNFITSITKSMVEGVLTGNITSHTHSYLPLNGGTLAGALTVPSITISGYDSVLPSHYFHNLYSSTDSSVYEHFGQGGDLYKVTYGHFRFFDGTGNYKTLKIGGDGTFRWNGTDVSLNGHTHSQYLPLTGGTLTGALTCNGDYINMNNDSGSRGYRGFFNQSNSTSRASGSHIFMYGGGEALGTNSVSIGYQAYAGIRNKDSDATTYPYIAWQWMPTEKFRVDTTNSSFGQTGEFYGYPLLPNEMVRWSIDGGQNVIYENSSSYKELLVVIKASDADTGLVFGGKASLPYRASKTLIAGKYIVGSGEYLKNITEITINNVKYYQVIIYTWSTTAFPTYYDFTQQVKVMCATKVNNSNYNNAYAYASGDSSVASGYSSVASGTSSVASGASSVASGYASVASGDSSVASGYSSVASGYYSVASGYYSLASGYYSVASHNFSVVLAQNGETMSSYQTIVGKFNAKVAGLFIIGNGTSDTARSNAFVVDDSGNVTAKYFSGYAHAIGNEGIKVYATNSNEINFGGTSSAREIYFGYSSLDSRPTPTTYNFGNGTATIQAASFSGNAATATALTSSAGSATQPIYFSNGKPVTCSYTLAKSVPSNAVFTDTTYSVATASADGLMSAAMFKAYMVKSVGVRQGDTAVIEGGSITNHSVYITQKKSNITNAYQQAVGENDVKIPNATKDYDGSMSYTDKRKLDKMPPTMFGATLVFYNNEILIDGNYGDYNLESGDATVDGYETIQENNHYITMVAFNIKNNDLKDKLRDGFVKFGYSSRDSSTYETMRLLQSNFDGSATLFVEFIHATPIGSKSFWFDCIWEVYPVI